MARLRPWNGRCSRALAACGAILALLYLLAAPATATARTAATAAPSASAPPQPDPADISTHTVPGVTGRAATAQLTPSQLNAFRRQHSAHAARATSQGPVRPQATETHDFWAVYPSGSVAPTGMSAVHSALPSLRTSTSSDVIYGPTMYPAGNSCIENTTAYFNDKAQVWAFDWCNGQDVGKATPMDSAFTSTYMHNGSYWSWVEKTDATTNTWKMFLYNYSTSTWDLDYTSSGYDPNNNTTGTDVGGWDAFEVYSVTNSSTGQLDICSDTAGKTFSASSIQQMEGGGWKLLSGADSTANAPGTIFGCSGLDASFSRDYSDWTVTNP